MSGYTSARLARIEAKLRRPCPSCHGWPVPLVTVAPVTGAIVARTANLDACAACGAPVRAIAGVVGVDVTLI